MILEAVIVSGFRSIDGPLRIPIGSPTVLAGHNDAGKSAAIEAIAFLLDTVKLTDRDRTFDNATSDGQLTRVSETVVEGEFRLRPDERQYFDGADTARLRRVYNENGTALEVLTAVPIDERLRDLGSQDVKTLKFRLQGLGLSDQGLKPDLIDRLSALVPNAEKFDQWVSAAADIKRLLPRVQRFDATSTQDPEDAILATLKTSYASHTQDQEIKGNLDTITRTLQERVADDAESLRQHLKRTCEDIGEIAIHPSVRLDSGLKSIEVSATNPRGEAVHLGQSGAGRTRRIALAVWEFNADLLSDSDADVVLLYDEPDTHLDYSHQRGFMKLLKAQSEIDNVRVVVATHSMNLIDGVDIARIVHLRHVNSRTTADQVTDDSDVGSHLGSIAASLGLRNTVLLHERLFVGVEGATESRALPVLFKLATGRHLQACGIAMWPCDNNDGALRFAQYLHRHGRDIVLVVDEDSRELKVFSEGSLGRHGLTLGEHVMTVGTRELEDCFSDAQWVACANREWPRVDGRPWTESDFAPHRAGKFSSLVEKMLREHSSVEVSGKPEILSLLAVGLTDPEDVPTPLRELFSQLIVRAEY